LAFTYNNFPLKKTSQGTTKIFPININSLETPDVSLVVSNTLRDPIEL
jgi:hypothetical protein